MKSLYFIFIVLLAEATTLIALQIALKRRGIDHYEQRLTGVGPILQPVVYPADPAVWHRQQYGAFGL